MLTIRLQRVGRTKKPTYRLIVSENKRDTQYTHLELLGTYNPTVRPKQIAFNAERITFWMGKGAQTSNTVHNLLVEQGIIKGDKRKAVRISKSRQAKIDAKKPKPVEPVAEAPAPAEAPAA